MSQQLAEVIWGVKAPRLPPQLAERDAHRSFSLLVKIASPNPILSLYPNLALHGANIPYGFD